MLSHPNGQSRHLAPNQRAELQQAPGTDGYGPKAGMGWVPSAVPRDGHGEQGPRPNSRSVLNRVHQPQHTDLRLLVVLHSHGDHVEADDARDEQIQVMAGAHLVDQEAEAGVIRIVGLALCFCSGRRAERHGKSLLCASVQSRHPHLPHRQILD